MMEIKVTIMDGRVRRYGDASTTELEECICRRLQEYKKLFGCVPNKEDYFCTSAIYARALDLALRDEKQLHNFLKERTEIKKLVEMQWLEEVKPYHKQYHKMFGYTPDERDYICTRDSYASALLRALEEKKELSEFLQKRTQKE